MPLRDARRAKNAQPHRVVPVPDAAADEVAAAMLAL
jgi:hypothetical protein